MTCILGKQPITMEIKMTEGSLSLDDYYSYDKHESFAMFWSILFRVHMYLWVQYTTIDKLSGPIKRNLVIPQRRTNRRPEL